MESLTRSKRVAKEYEGGILCVFRLTVDDYHRYAFVDDGELSREFHIPGVYHTVNPVAGEYYPIYKEKYQRVLYSKEQTFWPFIVDGSGGIACWQNCES